MHIGRDCDLLECDDRREVVERAAREWEAYGDRWADEGEEGYGDKSGGDCRHAWVPRGKGPEMVGLAAAAAAPAAAEVVDREEADLPRVRLMNRFRPFVCCACPWPSRASCFPFDLSNSLSFPLLLPRTLAGVGVVHTSLIRTPRRYISVLPSGSSRFELAYDSEESISISISISILSKSAPISCMPLVLLFSEGNFASSSSMTSQQPTPSW